MTWQMTDIKVNHRWAWAVRTCSQVKYEPNFKSGHGWVMKKQLFHLYKLLIVRSIIDAYFVSCSTWQRLMGNLVMKSTFINVDQSVERQKKVWLINYIPFNFNCLLSVQRTAIRMNGILAYIDNKFYFPNSHLESNYQAPNLGHFLLVWNDFKNSVIMYMLNWKLWILNHDISCLNFINVCNKVEQSKKFHKKLSSLNPH